MTINNRVQFVVFETALPAKPFMDRWEEYKRSPKSDQNVTLQKSELNGSFRYIAQHHLASDDIQFVFARPKRTSRVAQESIKVNLLGGYSLFETGNSRCANSGESKLFVFLDDSQIDINSYKVLTAESNLNVYEAYYHNCRHAYILEYYVRNEQVHELLQQLENLGSSNVAVYKQFAKVENVHESQKLKELPV